MITLITGRQGTGKSYTITEMIRQTAQTERVILIVPEQFTYESEKNILKQLGTECTINISVYSIKRLASAIASESGLSRISLLSQEGRRLVIKNILSNPSFELKVYSNVAGMSGFAEQILEIITEFKSQGLTAEELEELLETDISPSLKKKLADIISIYRTYSMKLDADRTDEEDFLVLAGEQAAESSTLKDAAVFIDGFSCFSGSEFEFLSKIIAASKSAAAALPGGEDEFFEASNQAAESIKQLAEKISREIKTIHLTEKVNSSQAVRFIEKNIMNYNDVFFEGSNNEVFAYEAEDPEDEVIYAASCISRLIRSGLRYKDIAVCCELKTYENKINEIFTRYDLEYFIDSRRDIIFSAPVKALLFIVSMTEPSFAVQDIIAFAKSGFSAVSSEEYMLLENYTLEYGIKYASSWQNRFTQNADGSYDLEKINEIKDRLQAQIQGIRDSLSGYSDVRDFCIRLCRYMNSSGFEAVISSAAEEFRKNGQYESANTYAQIYNKIISVTEQLHDHFGSEKLSPKTLHDMLSFAFLGSGVGIIPSTVDKISIGDISRMQAGNVRAVFSLGANEGMYPYASNISILTDDDRNAAKRNGLNLLPASGYARQQNSFLIYSLLSKSEQYLFVSRHTQDDNGETVQPALLYERLTDIMPLAAESGEDVLLRKMSAPKASFYMIADSGRLSGKRTSDDGNSELYSRIIGYYKENSLFENELNTLSTGQSFTNKELISDLSSYYQAIGQPFRASVSTLEKYASCPFAFFAEYILRPKQRIERSIKRTDIGSILHKVIENFSQQIISGEILLQPADIQSVHSAAENIAQSVFAQYTSQLTAGSSQNRYLLGKLTKASKAAAEEIVRQLALSDFKIAKTEVRFSQDSDFRPISVITDFGEVLVRGTIDRIDINETESGRSARIIDYKTSGQDFDIVRTLHGLSVQLPVYMKAASENDQDLNGAGMFYFRLMQNPVRIKKEMSEAETAAEIQKAFRLNGITVNDLDLILSMDKNAESGSFIDNISIKNGIVQDNMHVFDEQTFSAVIEHTQKMVRKHAEGILKADISISPACYKSQTACRYCDYKSLCKFSEELSGNKMRYFSSKNKQELIQTLKENSSEQMD